MGARGPQPKPTALKRLEGNPGNRRLNEQEVQPVGTLRKPAHVTGPAAEEWDRVVSSMPPGFYTAADVPVLETYCLTWGLYRNAIAAVASSIKADSSQDADKRDGFGGLGSKGSTGQMRVHPLLGEARGLGKLILQCADRLGMSPAARARLQAERDEAPHGEFAGLIGGRRASGEATH